MRRLLILLLAGTLLQMVVRAGEAPSARSSNHARQLSRCTNSIANQADIPIPFDQIGTMAAKQYKGDGLAITATPDGASLHCAFQRLNARVTTEGLWLASIVDGAKGEPFRVIARSLGRGEAKALPRTGQVAVSDQVAKFIRPRLTEEYSVGMEGVRQDFVIEQKPAGRGPMRLELEVDGAQAEQAGSVVKLLPTGSGRQLVYNQLKARDANGKEVKAWLEVVSASRLAVVLADEAAEYPVRIDPTFSDANWVSLGGVVGANEWINAATTDGAGNLYIGGFVSVAGNAIVNFVAEWNGSAWLPLGSGLNEAVLALAVSGTNLYAGGSFTEAGGVAATNIALWNGSAWSALGSGIDINGEVRALAFSGGTLYVGGRFNTAGGMAVTNIAAWNGNSWSALGSGMNGEVFALALSGPNLYAGGYFSTAGGVAANNIAQWNGNSWSTLGSGLNNGVEALAVLGTNLYAGGGFTSAGGVAVNDVAQWNGSSWSALGSGGFSGGATGSPIRSMAVLGNILYVGGSFTTAAGVSTEGVVEWNGSSWSALGVGIPGIISAMAASGNTVYAGGLFSSAGGVAVSDVAQWNGSSWAGLGTGLAASDSSGPFISAIAVSGNTTYVGGDFDTAGGVLVNHVAQWNGNAWSALGTGLMGGAGYGSYVHALAVSGNIIYAGGYFTNAGGVAANYVAAWNGNSWSALGSGMNNYVTALAVSGTNLYAGGQFTSAGGVAANYIAAWNGNSWSALGSGMNGDVDALAVSGGTLYAGGNFTTAGGSAANYTAQWNGSNWSALGSGIGGSSPFVAGLAVSGSNLYAGGNFGTAGGVAANNIAQWNGNSWSALGSGINGGVFALAASGTSLFAGGHFTSAGGVAADNIACWDGNTWSPLGSGVGYAYVNVYPNVLALAATANAVFVGGYFFNAGTNATCALAEGLLSNSSYNLALTQVGSGTNVITGLGVPNFAYSLDLATDLAPTVVWTPEVTNASPTMNLNFTNQSNLPKAFYRLRYVP